MVDNFFADDDCLSNICLICWKCPFGRLRTLSRIRALERTRCPSGSRCFLIGSILQSKHEERDGQTSETICMQKNNDAPKPIRTYSDKQIIIISSVKIHTHTSKYFSHETTASSVTTGRLRLALRLIRVCTYVYPCIDSCVYACTSIIWNREKRALNLN